MTCDIPVAQEVAYFRQHVLCDPSIASWACNLVIVTTEGSYGINDAYFDYAAGGGAGDWDENHANPAFIRAAYIPQWMMAMADQKTWWNMHYANKEQCWGTIKWDGTAPSGSCTHTPAATITTSLSQIAFNQMNTWLQSAIITGPKVCTGATAFTQVCTLPVTIGGNAAELAYYTGWLSNHTQATSFGSQQDIHGVITSTGGSRTLTQMPALYFNATAIARPVISIIAIQ